MHSICYAYMLQEMECSGQCSCGASKHYGDPDGESTMKCSSVGESTTRVSSVGEADIWTSAGVVFTAVGEIDRPSPFVAGDSVVCAVESSIGDSASMTGEFICCGEAATGDATCSGDAASGELNSTGDATSPGESIKASSPVYTGTLSDLPC